tara:strand:- start:410 stop:535 length:126 start_codon:yes stop_codon:yes gene_type:complete
VQEQQWMLVVSIVVIPEKIEQEKEKVEEDENENQKGNNSLF